MIDRYNDLAANERTYLAWMRTAIALIGFGFVIERFDLLMKTMAPAIQNTSTVQHSTGGRDAGIIMVGAGILVLLLSTWHFVHTTKRIESAKTESYRCRSVLTLGGVFLLLAVFILLYICRMTITQ